MINVNPQIHPNISSWLRNERIKKRKKTDPKRKDNDRETVCEYVRVNKIRLTLTHVCLRRWDDFYQPIFGIRYNSWNTRGTYIWKYFLWYCTLYLSAKFYQPQSDELYLPHWNSFIMSTKYSDTNVIHLGLQNHFTTYFNALDCSLFYTLDVWTKKVSTIINLVNCGDSSYFRSTVASTLILHLMGKT